MSEPGLVPGPFLEPMVLTFVLLSCRFQSTFTNSASVDPQMVLSLHCVDIFLLKKIKIQTEK